MNAPRKIKLNNFTRVGIKKLQECISVPRTDFLLTSFWRVFQLWIHYIFFLNRNTITDTSHENLQAITGAELTHSGMPANLGFFFHHGYQQNHHTAAIPHWGILHDGATPHTQVSLASDNCNATWATREGPRSIHGEPSALLRQAHWYTRPFLTACV